MAGKGQLLLLSLGSGSALKVPSRLLIIFLKSSSLPIFEVYSINEMTLPFNIQNNTNLIERFHGSLKDRTKVMRALKNKQTLQRFTDGWLVHYNFVRKHMGIEDRTPAEEAEIKYDVKNWADVVGHEKTPIVKPLEPQPVSESA
jgi:hypothetical protein